VLFKYILELDVRFHDSSLSYHVCVRSDVVRPWRALSVCPFFSILIYILFYTKGDVFCFYALCFLLTSYQGSALSQ
jgi:hypothetical protein